MDPITLTYKCTGGLVKTTQQCQDLEDNAFGCYTVDGVGPQSCQKVCDGLLEDVIDTDWERCNARCPGYLEKACMPYASTTPHTTPMPDQTGLYVAISVSLAVVVLLSIVVCLCLVRRRHKKRSCCWCKSEYSCIFCWISQRICCGRCAIKEINEHPEHPVDDKERRDHEEMKELNPANPEDNP